jgi:serine protease
LPPTAPPRYPRTSGRRLATLTACAAVLSTALLCDHTQASAKRPVPATAPAAIHSSGSEPGKGYEPEHIVVKYSPARSATPASVAHASASEATEKGSTPRVLSVPSGASLAGTLSKLRHQRNVEWAVPDYVAHTTSLQVPNDPGLSHAPGDWQQLQWNFSGPFGVNAPQAWANVSADGAPGGSKVVVAVLDTGVAYANRGKYRRSPDFNAYTFVQGHDFISRTPFANDHNGHGTFVAGTIAEATNNRYGLTGLAYDARIMPVRVLDATGEGDASVIAEGVRFAVNHHAKVINLSLEFSAEVSASDIPELMEALRYAHRRGVTVVAAAGNEGDTSIPYPARARNVIAVGATTEHGCLASYSNYGRHITLVAPGGGPDASLHSDPGCNPELPEGRDIFQMTFAGASPRVFGFPGGYEGTSMATPHVAAAAALLIASGVLGRKPSPAQVTARLKATARKLGGPADRSFYGAGLLDVGAATAR